MATTLPKNIIVIGGILAAAVVGAAIIVYMLSSAPTNVPLEPQDTAVPVIDGDGFDLNVLQRPGYKALDQRAVQDGLLPVKPPQTPGKANPFL